MRRAPFRILAATGLLAILYACGGGSTGPSTATTLSPPFLDGKVSVSRRSVQGDLIDDTFVFEGKVTWTKDKDELQPLRGGVAYEIYRGSLDVTHSGKISIVGFGGCALDGHTKLELKPADGFLVLYPDGSYNGHLKAQRQFATTARCRNGVTHTFEEYDMELRLEIKGNVVDGSRMQGEMLPLTFAIATFAGSWDFHYAY